MSDGLGMVSDGLRNVSDGLSNVSDGLGYVSDGLWNLSDGLGAFQMVFKPCCASSKIFEVFLLQNSRKLKLLNNIIPARTLL